MRCTDFMNLCPHGGPDVHPRPDPRARGPCPGTRPDRPQGPRRRRPPDDPTPGLQARSPSPGTDRVPDPRHRPPDRRQDAPSRTRRASKKSYQGSSIICPHCRDATGQTMAYLSVDATGVGQQGPGGAKAEGKMVYVGMVYNPAAFDPEAPQDARPIEQARYLAGLIDLEELGAQLRRQAGQVGMD